MSELTIKGTVTSILQQESGISNSGKEWKKQDFVIKTEGEYPKSICFTCFGDKTDLLMKIKEGQNVDVSFNLESREYNGKYFHNVNAWKIITNESEQQLPKSESFPVNEPEQDLPF